MYQENLITQELPGRTLLTGGKELLYFSGTSYLGMARNSAFCALLQEGMHRYGTNYSSSRLGNVQLSVFAEAESYLASFSGAEAALTISSGFLAGQLVVRTFARTGAFLYGPGTHPALWLEAPIASAQHFKKWSENVPNLISDTNAENIFILFNSLDPLYANKYSLDWLSHLNYQNKNITVIVDDSHGFGITGTDGAGIYKELAVPVGVRKIVVSSLGKALGIPGGVILSDKATIQILNKSPFFGGGSPVVPGYLYAFMQASDIYRQARLQLQLNINYFNSLIKQPDLFCCCPDYPVFYTPYNSLYKYLLAQDIFISSFPYPTPAHEPITRIILSSLHTRPDLEKLAKAIHQFTQEQQMGKMERLP